MALANSSTRLWLGCWVLAVAAAVAAAVVAVTKAAVVVMMAARVRRRQATAAMMAAVAGIRAQELGRMKGGVLLALLLLQWRGGVALQGGHD